MDWESPKLLLLAIPLIALLLWIESQSSHPMDGLRKRLLLVVRAVLILLALLALAGPNQVHPSSERAVVLVLDHSQSMGEEGLREVFKRAAELKASLRSDVQTFAVAMGDEPALLPDLKFGPERVQWQRQHGGQTQIQNAVEFAQALFPGHQPPHCAHQRWPRDARQLASGSARGSSVWHHPSRHACARAAQAGCACG